MNPIKGWVKCNERLPVGTKPAVNTYTIEVGTLTIKEDGAYFETEFTGNEYFYLFSDPSLYEHIIWHESETPVQSGEERLLVENEKLKDLLVKYESWEADMIMKDEMWWPNNVKDSLPDDIYNKMLELQSERNDLLERFTTKSYKNSLLGSEQNAEIKSE